MTSLHKKTQATFHSVQQQQKNVQAKDPRASFTAQRTFVEVLDIFRIAKCISISFDHDKNQIGNNDNSHCGFKCLWKHKFCEANSEFWPNHLPIIIQPWFLINKGLVAKTLQSFQSALKVLRVSQGFDSKTRWWGRIHICLVSAGVSDGFDFRAKQLHL